MGLRPTSNATAALKICTPPGEDIIARLIQLSPLMVYPLSLPQKWQARFPQPQQKKIPRARTGRQGIPAER